MQLVCLEPEIWVAVEEWHNNEWVTYAALVDKRS
jgi:hypothetical protein